MGKQKLELAWIGKDKRTRLKPSIQREYPEMSYHTKHWVADTTIFMVEE